MGSHKKNLTHDVIYMVHLRSTAFIQTIFYGEYLMKKHEKKSQLHVACCL